MIRRRLLPVKLTSAIILLLLLVATVALADTFDVPTSTKVVHFGIPAGFRAQPKDAKTGYGYRPPPHDKLQCFYYPEFMVKQYENQWVKGAYWLAIVPAVQGAPPACTRSHVAGERVIRGKEWWGYFRGVKGHLVFFNEAEGTNGGLPFAIYDSRTGKKIFEDTPFDEMRVSVAADQGFTLTYLRVVEAGCDLHHEKAACWNRVRKRLDLKTSQAPTCVGYADIGETRIPSAVAYPVEVNLFPQPIIKTVPGPVKCRPVD